MWKASSEQANRRLDLLLTPSEVRPLPIKRELPDNGGIVSGVAAPSVGLVAPELHVEALSDSIDRRKKISQDHPI